MPMAQDIIREHVLQVLQTGYRVWEPWSTRWEASFDICLARVQHSSNVHARDGGQSAKVLAAFSGKIGCCPLLVFEHE